MHTWCDDRVHSGDNYKHVVKSISGLVDAVLLPVAVESANSRAFYCMRFFQYTGTSSYGIEQIDCGCIQRPLI